MEKKKLHTRQFLFNCLTIFHDQLMGFRQVGDEKRGMLAILEQVYNLPSHAHLSKTIGGVRKDILLAKTKEVVCHDRMGDVKQSIKDRVYYE